DLHEIVEYPFEVRARDPDSLVDHLDHHHAFLLPAADEDGAARTELHGVRHEIEQDLADALWIGHQLRRPGLYVEPQGRTIPLGERRHRPHQILDDRVELDLAGVQHETAGLELR